MNSSDYCTDCKRSTEVVFDHSAGDTICSECGLVLESHSIDETSEWRVFANDSDNHSNDPVRVGGPTNPLLSDGAGLSTFISKPSNKGAGTGTRADGGGDYLFSKRVAINNPDRVLTQAFEAIATMADRLALVSTIKDRANEIYKKVEDQKSSRGKNQDAIVAACLLIACNQEGVDRTFKEIRSVANGATKKEIGRAKTYIVTQLNLDMGTKHSGGFVRRFCSNLGMNSQAIKAAQEAFQKSKEFDIRRIDISIAAAIIFQILDNKKALRDISVATGVAEGTIKHTYKDIYPHFSKIIPSWYCKEEDLKNLSP